MGGTANVTMSKNKVTELCAKATSNAQNSFFSFSDIASSGYQFDREFMNGGSDWNNGFKTTYIRKKALLFQKILTISRLAMMVIVYPTQSCAVGLLTLAAQATVAAPIARVVKTLSHLIIL